jgi:hypothetical protein
MLGKGRGLSPTGRNFLRQDDVFIEERELKANFAGQGVRSEEENVKDDPVRKLPGTGTVRE